MAMLNNQRVYESLDLFRGVYKFKFPGVTARIFGCPSMFVGFIENGN